MTTQIVHDALRRRPFEPFQVILSSGDVYEVRHPEFAWLVKGGLYIGLPPDSEDLPERVVYLSLPHIADVEHLASA